MSFIILITNSTAEAQTQLGNDIDGAYALDRAGTDISMPDASTIAIGEPYFGGVGKGRVRIFTWNGTAWVQKGSFIYGEEVDDESGKAISMPDANTIAIGAYLNDGIYGVYDSYIGHVRVYEYIGTSWVQKGADIDGENEYDRSGHSVSMPDANTVAIGAIWNDNVGSEAGHARVYSWNGSAWVQKGTDIDGEAEYDYAGFSVSMPDSNTVAVSAVQNDGGGTHSGHVRIYNWNGSAWIQKGADIDGETTADNSGVSVSMPDSNTIAIGADENDATANNAGHVRIYSWNGSAWVQKGADIDGEAADDYSGISVSMPDSNTVAIGARSNDGGATDAGHVRIYTWNGSAWTQYGNDINGEAAYDYSGSAVSMPDNNTVAIGAPYNDGTANMAGHVRVFTFCTNTTYTDTLAACDSLIWIDGITYYADNNTATWTITNVAGCDSVVTLNLTVNYTYDSIDTYVGCDSLTWIDGITYYADNTTATHILNNPTGCDTLVHLDLTIVNIDTSITQASNVLTVNQSGASYQWLDCTNSYAIIVGETNQSYTATSGGSYAIEITQNGCVDTSVCYTVVFTILENDFGKDFILYPNPTKRDFSIDLGACYSKTDVSISDLSGKTIQSYTFKNNQRLDLSVEEAAGIYILIIRSGDKEAIVRLVKK